MSFYSLSYLPEQFLETKQQFSTTYEKSVFIEDPYPSIILSQHFKIVLANQSCQEVIYRSTSPIKQVIKNKEHILVLDQLNLSLLKLPQKTEFSTCVKESIKFKNRISNIIAQHNTILNEISIIGFSSYQTLIFAKYEIKQGSLKQKSQEIIRFTELGIESHAYDFSLGPRSIFIYSKFNEKMKPVSFWQIKHDGFERKKFQLSCLENNFSIQSMKQLLDDSDSIVFACQRYFLGNHQSMSCFIWVYNIRVGYTRSILDFSGYINHLHVEELSLILEVRSNKEDSELITINLQFFTIFQHTLKDMHFLTQTDNLIIVEREGKIMKLQKLKKKVHYHKLMLQLNLSMNMMQQVLKLL